LDISSFQACSHRIEYNSNIGDSILKEKNIKHGLDIAILKNAKNIKTNGERELVILWV